MQLRYGPNRAGPYGSLQPIADLIKLIRKESFFPASAIDLPYIAAPAISMFTALAAFSVIPFGAGWHLWRWHVDGEIANVSIALLLIFALGSIGIYGFIVGGWASESKYSLLGSMRTCAQLVSYEVSLALSVLGVVLMAGSLSLVDIVNEQHNDWWYAGPADCIRVVPAENTAVNRVSPGERYARIYEINMSRCIFCGYCELACPFDAITLGNEFELAEYNRDDQIYTKDMLLAPPILLEIIMVIGLSAGDGLSHTPDVPASFGSPASIGRLFLTDHLLAFEI